MTARLAVVLAAVLCGGCFQTDVVLTVRPDGSARLVETVAVEGIVGLSVPVSLGEMGPPERAGAELVGLESAERLGAFVTTTTWEIPRLDGFRYDVRDAGRAATMLRRLVAWVHGQDDVAPFPAAELAFSVAPSAAGSDARLGVAVGRTLRAADLARLPWHPAPLDAALGLAYGIDGPVSPEHAAELAARPLAPGQLGPADVLSYVPWVQASEALVQSGTAAVRIAVAVEGEVLDAEGGWREGDRWVLADVRLAEAFPSVDDRVALADSAAAARFDAAVRADGLDRPGARLPPESELSLRFR